MSAGNTAWYRLTQRYRRTAGKLFTRGMYGLLSQALNTASNLCIALFLVSQVSSDSFGAWSVGYASFLITLTVTRAVATTPMILGSTGVPPQRQVKGSLSLSIMIGTLAGLVLVFGAVLGGPQIESALYAFALVTPFLCLQDAMRYNFIRRFAPSRAAIIDAVRLGLQLGAFAYLLGTATVSNFTATLGWGIAALASCIVGFALHRAAPSFAAGIEFVKANRWASGRLFVDSLISGLSSNALPFLLTAFSGLSAAGAFRAGQTLMGGIGLVVRGMTPIVVTEAIQKVRRGNPGWTILWTWTALIGGFSAVYGLAILLIPESVGRILLGDTWQEAVPILIPLVLQAVLRGPVTGAPILLRAGFLLNTAIKLRFLASLPNVILPAIGAAIWGLQGAAWGLVVATIFASILSIAIIKRTRGAPPENSNKSFEDMAE